MYVFIHSIFVRTSAYINVRVHVRIHVGMSIGVLACMDVCLYKYVYACMMYESHAYV